MLEADLQTYAQKPPELIPDVLRDIKSSVRTGLQIDALTMDQLESRVFLESVSRSFFYASQFLGIPGVDFRLGDGINGTRIYLAKADVEENGSGVITFNENYVRSRLMNSIQTILADPSISSYRMDASPAEVTAHEAYHVWQLMAAPKRVRREASMALNHDNWNDALTEKAAKRFSRLLVLNMTMSQNKSEDQLFGDRPSRTF